MRGMARAKRHSRLPSKVSPPFLYFFRPPKKGDPPLFFEGISFFSGFCAPGASPTALAESHTMADDKVAVYVSDSSSDDCEGGV
jgi:hypothetical protein